jgi:hypothetical protein
MVASRFTTAAAALLCFSLAALPTPSAAQASREGPTFAAAGAWPGFGVRYPDIAYDPINDVYLTVAGSMTHGRFVTPDGVPVGTNEFYIPSSAAYNQTARVEYGGGKFLVTWLDVRNDPLGERGVVYGRLVSYGAGGTPVFAGPDFLIGAAVGFVNSERAAAVAYSTVSKRFLVVYHQNGGGGQPTNDIRGQLVSDTGQLVGPAITISFDNHFQGEVGVGYSPASDKFLVAYRHYYEPAGPATIQSRTVSAVDGALGTPADMTASSNTNVPEVAYNTKNNQFLLSWWQAVPNSAGVYYGRLVNPDGVAAAAAVPMITNYGGYDSLGIDYNVRADTFFAVVHGRAPTSLPQEDVGAEMSGVGVPGVEFDVTATGNKLGNFYPRIAASTARNEWMMVTSTAFQVTSGQRIKTLANGGGPPPPPPPPPPAIELTGPNVPNGSWFLAEGAESGNATGFHTFYLVSNEHDDPVSCRAWFVRDDGRQPHGYQEFTVPARSRTTISLSSAAGAGAFAAIFQSLTAGRDIYVSRSIYFGNNLEGSTGVSATKSLATSWYFAEGSRGGELFDNFFLLFNPLPTDTTAQVVFLTASGEVITKQYTVPAERRLTIYANAIPELAGKDFSTTVTAAAAVVAERAMYWRLIGGTDPSWVGGTASMGAVAPAMSFVFAEGASAARFETFYLLLNPNQTPITVNARYLPELGAATVRAYTIPPRSRHTVYLNGELGNVGGVGATFTSDSLPFLAERSIYWGAGRVEGSNVIGASAASPEWHFAEGATGGLFDTFLLLSNPGTNDATVRLTLYVEGRGRFTASAPALLKTVPAGRRITIHMNDFLTALETAEGLPVNDLRGKSFSAKVTVLSGDPIVAEEAIYWNAAGADFWRSGSAFFGIPQ